MTLRSCIINKQETDFIHKGLQERQKEDKLMLGQIYQNQIDQARKIKANEKLMEKELERMQIERLQAIDPDAYNKLKKQAYQHELRQELDQKSKMKQYDQVMREQSVRETRKMMDDYARKEMINEQNYRNKFSKFDQNMQKRLNDYNNYVMKPTLEKQTNLDMIERKNIADYNRRQAELERQQDELRKNQMKTTSNVLKTQIQEKNKLQNLKSELGQIEVQRTSDRVYEINSFDQMLKEDKKKRQEMYRQMLTSQIQYNNGLKSFGNMTKVEKMMNKDDLRAYKKFDNNQYSMIPGISPDKKFAKRDPSHPVKHISYDEEQRRLDAYGYGRYLKKVPTAGPIENYNAGMSQSRGGNNTFNPMNRSYTGGSLVHQNDRHDHSAVPDSRRHNSGISARSQVPRTLRNAGAHSVSHEKQNDQRPAGSPSGAYPYRQQIL